MSESKLIDLNGLNRFYNNLKDEGIGKTKETLFSSNTWLNADTNLTLTSAITSYDLLIIKCEYSIDDINPEITNTKMVTATLNDNISLSFERNSTQYCILEGKFTTNTNFALDSIELNGFTKFRVSEIIGITI